MRTSPWIAALALTGALVACEPEQTEVGEEPAVTEERMGEDQGVRAEADAEPMELVQEAQATFRDMQADPELQTVLNDARGILIVPNFGRGAAVVGAQGGEGVFYAREGGSWQGPVFYDVGGISVGAQFGGEGGQVAMIVMNDEAVNAFESDENFSVDAEAGFAIADWSEAAQASAARGQDVVLWSDTEGAFAGAQLGVSDVSFDEEENQEYYGQAVTPEQVLTGNVEDPHGGGLEGSTSARS